MQPPGEMQVSEDSILHLDIDGVILDGKEILADLRKYAYDKKIKGVILRLNSPGGVVGPSQEIYSEIKRIREELEKPVFVSANAIMASGGYYIAVGADKIYVNAGTLMGSIGVIMEFANLSELYDWAKIQRYSLKTGKFKDTGTNTRAMTQTEKDYLQDVIDDVHQQFMLAVADGRNKQMRDIEPLADGRIFTGSKGVEYGLVDKVATYKEALDEMGELTGLGKNPPVFNPKMPKEFLLEVLGRTQLFNLGNLPAKVEQVLPTKLLGQPLYLYPAYLGVVFEQAR
tara:strand:+ start:3206 stop:4060 length:855 start_codon:yes stop_codon:yes gene_type:complete